MAVLLLLAKLRRAGISRGARLCPQCCDAQVRAARCGKTDAACAQVAVRSKREPGQPGKLRTSIAFKDVRVIGECPSPMNGMSGIEGMHKLLPTCHLRVDERNIGHLYFKEARRHSIHLWTEAVMDITDSVEVHVIV